MNKIKKILLILIVLSFGFSLPNVVTKYKTENSSDTIEVAVDYKQIYLNSKRGSDEFEEKIHEALRGRGIKSIGLNENNLYELERRDFLHVIEGSELEKNLWSQNHNIDINKKYTYVLLPESEKREEILQVIKDSQIASIKKYDLNNTLVIELDKRMNDVYKIPLLYLESDYEYLAPKYNIIPRISNGWDERFPILEEQLKKWNEEKYLSVTIFNGTEALGYEDIDGKVKITPNKFISESIGIGIVESFSPKDKQKGVNEYARSSDFNIVRVHSISESYLENTSYIEMKRLVHKAAKERNIRIFYVNPFLLKSDTETEDEYLERLTYAIKPIDIAIKKAGFDIGQAKPFVSEQNNALSSIGIISSLLGSLFLLSFALIQFVSKINHKLLENMFKLMVASGTLLVLGAYTTGLSDALIKVASLGLSVLLPVWASLHLAFTLEKKEVNLSSALKQIAMPLVVLYFVGLTYLIGMNHGIEHVTYIEPFRGVSLTLTVPPFVVGVLMLILLRNSISIKDVLFHKVRIVDIMAIGLLGVFFVFYESRSGNGGTLLPFEALLRGWLEDTLPWRPRTKEIFFAFPLLVLMIGFWKKSKWIKILLPFVAVGFASVFNTFTHFHTPIVASVGRTILSVSIGVLIGFVAYIILKNVLKIVSEIKLPRK